MQVRSFTPKYSECNASLCIKYHSDVCGRPKLCDSFWVYFAFAFSQALFNYVWGKNDNAWRYNDLGNGKGFKWCNSCSAFSLANLPSQWSIFPRFLSFVIKEFDCNWKLHTNLPQTSVPVSPQLLSRTMAGTHLSTHGWKNRAKLRKPKLKQVRNS